MTRPPASSPAFLRRSSLLTLANPDPGHDYLVDLGFEVPVEETSPVRAMVRYVPDRLILNPSALPGYLNRLADTPRSGLEALALLLLDDLNNEVVPRWLQVAIHQLRDNLDHTTTVEDRQPGWHNPRLINRLTRL